MLPYNVIYTRRTDWRVLVGEVLGGIAFVVVIGGLLMLLGVA